MIINRQFYGFVARGGRDGALQGYSVEFADVACDDAGVPLKKANGENFLEAFTGPLTLTQAQTTLPEVLDKVLSAALLRNDQAEAETKTTKEALDTAITKIKALEAELATLKPVDPVIP